MDAQGLPTSGGGGLVALPLAPGDIPELMLPADDPWLLTAFYEVGAFLLAHPELPPATVMPFWLTDVELVGKPWRARGVGRLLLPPDGRPLSMHVPGKQAFCTTYAPVATKPASAPGRMCYLASWFRASGRPYLLEVWEMLLVLVGSEGSVRVSWRPDFGPPRRPRLTLSLSALTRTERHAIADAVADMLEGKPTGGRKSKTRDPAFERELESAVKKLIIQNDGDPFQVDDLRTVLLKKKDAYYDALGRSGLTAQQVQDWVTTCRRDYNERAADDEDWQLPVPLAELPRHFPD